MAHPRSSRSRGPDRTSRSAGQLAAALTKQRLEQTVTAATVEADSNRLRAALLSSVSHDLKTPLASIKAYASSLLQGDVKWRRQDIDTFARSIVEEADRLNVLIGNLLDLSRLTADSVQLRLQAVGIDDVIPPVLDSLPFRDATIVVETPNEPAPVARYVADGALDLAFYFPSLKVRWDPDEIRTTLRAATDLAGDRFAWPLSSHDDPRAAQRFDTDGDGPDRARAYLTLLAGLPGSVVILQGDELGIDTTQLSAEGLRDPVAIRHPGAIGRDLSRTPMPWAVGPGFGFTPGTPWLPHPEDTTSAHTVEHQRQDPRSPLMRTRELFRIRATSIDLTGRAPIHWIDHPDPALVAYRRGGTLVVLNTAAEHRAITPIETRSLLYSSTTPLERGGSIPANTAIIATI